MSKSITLKGILPEPDPRSRLAYLLVVLHIPVTLLVFYITGMRINGSWPWSLVPLATFIIFNAWMLRRAGHQKISTGIETISLLVVKGSLILIIQYPLMALPIDFKDDWLVAADRIFMFDWLTFTRFANGTFTFPVLLFAYTSLVWQGIILLSLLCATGRLHRAWMTVTATIVALLVTIAIFPFFPADGTYAGCGLNPADVPARPGMCNYGFIIHHIKDDGLRLIDVSMATGLVAMPSFHAAAGVIYLWSSWAIKWLRVPSLVLNGIMLIATITVGAHYMVDIPAGAAVAVLSIWITRCFVRDIGATESANR